VQASYLKPLREWRPQDVLRGATLTPYRRHREKCKFTSRRAKRSCPIWAQGSLEGEKIRRSLDLTTWEAATKKIRDWEVHGRKKVISLSDAYDRFIVQHEANNSSPATIQKHRLLKRACLELFGNVPVRSLTVDDVSRFRAWTVGIQTTVYKIGRLRSFFKFCVGREWLEKNPSKSHKLPKVDKIDVKPYEAAELQRIIKAIDDQLVILVRCAFVYECSAQRRPVLLKTLTPVR
jgi:integrase